MHLDVMMITYICYVAGKIPGMLQVDIDIERSLLDNSLYCLQPVG